MSVPGRLARSLGLLLAALLPGLPAVADPPGSETLSIAAARRLPLGSVVTVEGAVTVPPGAFKSGTSDEGFAIQDRTGGIYVSVPTHPGLRLRQQIRATGRLADNLGLLILVPTRLTPLNRPGWGQRVLPTRVTTGQIGEGTEGRLVELQARVAQPIGSDLPFGYRLFVDDGSGEVQVYVYASTHIDLNGLQPGQPVRVVGLSGQYADHYELWPRAPGDIRRIR
jgi:hypothetical protein